MGTSASNADEVEFSRGLGGQGRKICGPRISPDYKMGITGVSGCGDGYEWITDRADCEAALTALGLPAIGGNISGGTGTMHCYVDGNLVPRFENNNGSSARRVCSRQTLDCAGTLGGSAVIDQCGVCDGDNSSCADCAGTPNGSAVTDQCGVCDGDNSSCADCAGTPNGSALTDQCGVCDGDNSSCAD